MECNFTQKCVQISTWEGFYSALKFHTRSDHTYQINKKVFSDRLSILSVKMRKSETYCDRVLFDHRTRISSGAKFRTRQFCSTPPLTSRETVGGGGGELFVEAQSFTIFFPSLPATARLLRSSRMIWKFLVSAGGAPARPPAAAQKQVLAPILVDSIDAPSITSTPCEFASYLFNYLIAVF